MEDKLEKLLLEKPFSALSLQEKEYVLSQITEVDYHKFHFLLQASKKSFEEERQKMNVNNTVGDTVNLAFKKKYKKQFFKNLELKKRFQKHFYKPAFALVGIIVLGIVLFGKFQKNNNSSIENVTTFLLSQKIYNNMDLTKADSIKNSFMEMNKYMQIRTQGFDSNFEETASETSLNIN
ncbi:hypothetical protein KO566_00960 [Flavobacteriaceae bacterium XHP0103]|uniref:hypothetical protein n=1 Tax=Marixanthotalea marina TaxID=2844359 RepID=UPI002989A0E5|nr:hypothetical protein [Marixanthotalea marina]MBU3820613.1 hypothetical protein [Marixanthotalea marina]